MHSTRISGESGDALGASAFAPLMSALALVLLAIAGFCASPTLGAEIPTVEDQMAASGEIVPIKLPRSRAVPATLQVGFTSESLNSPVTPELTRIAIEISRNVTLQTAGLPSCSLAKLFSTYASARQICAGSFVGHGSVTSEVTLPGQAPATLSGHLLAFYAFAEGRPRILAQVTSGAPLPLTYVIPLQIENAHGAFGTSLVVPKMSNIQGKCKTGHPNCFAQPYTLKGVYGHISKFELSLNRRFAHAGRRESFVSADCPARGHLPGAVFPLAKVGLTYANGVSLSQVATRSCKVSN